MTGVADQPDPTPRPDEKSIHELVVLDLAARLRKGIDTYGTQLTAHNGRDALQDAYEECLDMAVYLRQAIEERDNPHPNRSTP